MPRRPQPNIMQPRVVQPKTACDHLAFTSTSEDNKLKILEAKLREQLQAEFVLKNGLKTINDESLIIADDTETNIKINSIVKITSVKTGLKTTYTILFNDGTTYVFDVLDGSPGEKGDIGEKGDTGETGLSAYQLAVKLGYTGTEQEWLTQLKGEKGDTGPAGTYIAGKHITIDNNVISADDAKTQAAFTATQTIGAVEAGTTFKAETLLEDIIKQMLGGVGFDTICPLYYGGLAQRETTDAEIETLYLDQTHNKTELLYKGFELPNYLDTKDMFITIALPKAAKLSCTKIIFSGFAEEYLHKTETASYDVYTLGHKASGYYKPYYRFSEAVGD